MDRPHDWQQEVVIKPMEEILVPANNSSFNNNNLSKAASSSSSSFERRVIRQKAAAGAVKCPRCDSRNTKFCYYNNYSISQPRYFCKSCRRYWTEGGTLRNIPVGGGSRKNNKTTSRSSSSTTSYNSSSYNNSSKELIPGVISSSSASSASIVISENPPALAVAARIHHQLHDDQYVYAGEDLNLGFPSSSAKIINVVSDDEYNNNIQQALLDATNSTTRRCSSTSSQLSALELLTGITTTTARGSMNSFVMPIPDHRPANNYLVDSSAASTHELMSEFKIPSSLGFSLDDHGTRPPYNLYPFDQDQLKKLTNTAVEPAANHDDGHPHVDQNKDNDSNGFWNGIMGTGGAGSW